MDNFCNVTYYWGSSGLINPAGEAMLIDVSTPENRSFMYSVSYWANNLSIMIGIMVGVVFVDYLFPLLVVLLSCHLLRRGLL